MARFHIGGGKFVTVRHLEGEEARKVLLRKFPRKFPPCKHRWSKTFYKYRLGSIGEDFKQAYLGWETFHLCPLCGCRLLVDLPR